MNKRKGRAGNGFHLGKFHSKVCLVGRSFASKNCKQEGGLGSINISYSKMLLSPCYVSKLALSLHD